MIHKAGTLQGPSLPIGEHRTYASSQRQINKCYFRAKHPHANQPTGQQYQAVPRQGQEDECGLQQQYQHQATDQQGYRLHLNQGVKILMPNGHQHIQHVTLPTTRFIMNEAGVIAPIP